MSDFSFEIIDAADAPPKPKEMTARARKSLDLLEALTPGKVAKVKVAKEDLKGTRLSLTRVASINEIKVRVWEDGEFLYIERA